jgi:putative ABC transport system substrate-binding protein
MPSLALGRNPAGAGPWRLIALVLALIVQAGLAQAQTRTLRAGLLFLGPQSTYPSILQALRTSFGQYGYTEGQNLVLVPRYAEGHAERLPALARELAAEKVDVIITGGERNLVVTRTTVPEIPVVVVACESIEKLLGLFDQYKGNATGFSCISSTLYGKRIEYLKSVVPGMQRLALLYNPA